MKRIFTLVVLFMIVGLMAQEVKGPKMELENPTIDYGDVMKGEDDGVRTFKFTNTGNEPLKLVNVKSSCGCTVPTYPKEDIMPGESGEITVKYNMRPGRFSKSITITTNGVNEKTNQPNRVILRIKGNVIDPNAPAPIQKEKPMMSHQ
jgi:hypothetical protein